MIISSIGGTVEVKTERGWVKVVEPMTMEEHARYVRDLMFPEIYGLHARLRQAQGPGTWKDRYVARSAYRMVPTGIMYQRPWRGKRKP
jgi:hypothetical protein